MLPVVLITRKCSEESLRLNAPGAQTHLLPCKLRHGNVRRAEAISSISEDDLCDLMAISRALQVIASEIEGGAH